MDQLKVLIDSDITMQLQTFSCFFMTGVIWIIQLLHYPSFRFVEFKQFYNFQKFHTQTITYIVGPLMILEIFSGLYLLLINEFSFFWLVQMILLILIWLCTAFLSVRLHTTLSQPHIGDIERLQVINLLVKMNWPRTLLWSLRSLLFMVNFKVLL